MNNEQQTQQADDPSGPGWRDVEVGEVLGHTDMVRDIDGEWVRTGDAGWQVPPGLRGTYRRRIEPPQPQPEPEPQPNPDDPSGPGWRDVLPDELLQPGDMFEASGRWARTAHPGLRAGKGGGGTYRRRIEPQQPTPDDPSGENCRQALAAYAGRTISVCGHLSDYGDRIQESQQVSDEQQTQQPSDSEPETMEDLRKRLAVAVRQNVELA